MSPKPNATVDLKNVQYIYNALIFLNFKFTAVLDLCVNTQYTVQCPAEIFVQISFLDIFLHFVRILFEITQNIIYLQTNGKKLNSSA